MRRQRREYPKTRAKPVLSWRLVASIARRRRKAERLAYAFMTFAVALTVAASFVVTCMIGRAGNHLDERLTFAPLPVDAMLFDGTAQGIDPVRWQGVAQAEEFPCLRVDSRVGPLFVLGLAKNAPSGTVLLAGDAYRDALGGGGSIALFDSSNGRLLGTWAVAPAEEFLPGSSATPFWGWASPESVAAAGKASPGVPLTGISFTLFLNDQDGKDALARSLSGLEGVSVFMPETGRRTVARALKAAYLPWQAVSAISAVTAASSVACVLAVLFLGRKRVFGILKVMGVTRADLWRLVLAEATVLGSWGLPLGIALGWVLNHTIVRAPVGFIAYVASAGLGLASLFCGAALPVLLVKNATCDQLLNNRPVLAISNPSCAECGLCGGF